jgi:hypothetical protein
MDVQHVMSAQSAAWTLQMAYCWLISALRPHAMSDNTKKEAANRAPPPAAATGRNGELVAFLNANRMLARLYHVLILMLVDPRIR